MDNFDFEKVHKVMTFLNWTWRNEGVPSVAQLKATARKYLEECAMEIHEPDWGMGSGGFMVRKTDNDYLSLTFELEFVDSTFYKDFD